MPVGSEQLRIAWKGPCRVATTSDIPTLAGGAPSTVDGVALALFDRVLVVAQSTASQNGIYIVNTVGTGANGVWNRAQDMNASEDLVPGVEVFVSEGLSYARTKFQLYTVGTMILGTTALDFIPGRPLVKDDLSSTQIKSSGAFQTSYDFTNAVDMRNGHTDVTVWVVITDATGISAVTVACDLSDDGTTVPFGGTALISSDDSISNGDFNANPYEGTLSIAGAGSYVMSFPKMSGKMRFGVKANASGGAYTVRAQRLVN